MGSTAQTAAELLSKSDMQILTNRGYTLSDIVGEGSYAKVYQCKKCDGSKTHWLACKIIDSNKAPVNFVKKFLTREIEILTKVSHPHIIHLFSMLHKGSRFFIFMRLAEKGDLLEYILKKNHVGENRARTWTAQLSLALEYLHAMGIVHRDIKTENILITSSFNAKLSDFGFARYIYINGMEVLCQTHCGSMPYTAPEVLKGKRYDARKSDMWSLGVVAYVMLNKRLPFNGSGSQEAMIQRQMEKKISFESKEASPNYINAIYNLLEPDITKRWSAAALLNSAWIRMDERLTIRSKHEKEALARAMSFRDRSLAKESTGPIKSPDKIKLKTKSSETSTENPKAKDSAVAIIRGETQASYTSMKRDANDVPNPPHEFAMNNALRTLGKKKEQAIVTKTKK